MPTTTLWVAEFLYGYTSTYFHIMLQGRKGRTLEAGIAEVLTEASASKKANRLLPFLLLIAAPLLTFELFPIMQLHTAREAELRQEASHFLDLVDAEQRRIIQDIHHILFALTEAGVGHAPVAINARSGHHMRGLPL
ncbi:hypothetical protein [Azospirillum tabaci]|uniref:hypothetical protein n=1 Tax=Azospirillum tabaci TaxID=2752310 RepID=UPI0016614F92|nr:hypothetical protein [Azospirillum tabaci]